MVQIAATAPINVLDASVAFEDRLFIASPFELEDPLGRTTLRREDQPSVRRSRGKRSRSRASTAQRRNRRERSNRLGTSRTDRTQRRRDRLSSSSRSRRERDREPGPPIGGGGGGAAPTQSDITVALTTNQPSFSAATFVPVQGYSNGFGAGSAMGHWDETVFGSELMTPRLNAGANNLSSISVGLLNDLGYNVDYSGSLVPASTDPGRRFNISIIFSGADANRQTFESYFLEAASFWEGYIYSGAASNDSSSDLTIYTSMFYSESSTLGSAGPTRGFTNDNQTVFQAVEGVVNLNSYYYTAESLSDPTRSAAFTATIRHEIGHVLGIGTFWPNGSLYGVGEPTNTSPSTFEDYAFIGANAVREYNTLITDNTYAAPTSLLAPGESGTALTVASATEPETSWFCASCGGLHLSEDARAHAAIPELTLVNALSEVVLGEQATQDSTEPPRNSPLDPVDPVTGLAAGSHESPESADAEFITFSTTEPNATTDWSSFNDSSQQIFIAEPVDVDQLGGLMPDPQRTEALASPLTTTSNTEPSFDITQTSEDFIL